jgi:hypothetical protein
MVDFFVEDPHSLTEKLAYEYWESRGRPLGSPEVDWSAAERTLALSLKYRDLPLSSLSLVPYEGPYVKELVRS